jgi:hypothetical protein
MEHQVTNWRGNVIGHIKEQGEKGEITYYSHRSYSKGEIFRHPKYLNALGLSLFVIDILIKDKVKWLNFYITDYEKEPFEAIISLKEFLEKAKDYQGKGENSDPQKILPMHFWTRRYKNQSVLC